MEGEDPSGSLLGWSNAFVPSILTGAASLVVDGSLDPTIRFQRGGQEASKGKKSMEEEGRHASECTRDTGQVIHWLERGCTSPGKRQVNKMGYKYQREREGIGGKTQSTPYTGKTYGKWYTKDANSSLSSPKALRDKGNTDIGTRQRKGNRFNPPSTHHSWSPYLTVS